MKIFLTNCKLRVRATASAVIAFFATPLTTAYAALPVADDVVGGSGVVTTNSPFAIIRELTTSTVGLAAIAISSIVTIGIGWQMYAAFLESRRTGEWKGFATTALIGIGLIIVVVVLALLGVEYAAP